MALTRIALLSCTLALWSKCLARDERCEERWMFLHQACYQFVSCPMVTWNTARQACEKAGAQLLMINSVDERDAICQKTRELYRETWWWWTGLQRNGTSHWQWLDNSSVPEDVLTWRTGQPDNKGGRENCAEIDFFVEINDRDCETYGAYICQKDPKLPATGEVPKLPGKRRSDLLISPEQLQSVSINQATEPSQENVSDDVKVLRDSMSQNKRCKDGWAFVDDACYQFVTCPKVTWDTARLACEKAGAQLLVVNTQAEYNEVMNETLRLKVDTLWWTGLQRNATSRWQWLDGTPVSDDFLKQHRLPLHDPLESEDCVEVGSHRWISGIRCHALRSYICEKVAKDDDHPIPLAPIIAGVAALGLLAVIPVVVVIIVKRRRGTASEQRVPAIPLQQTVDVPEDCLHPIPRQEWVEEERIYENLRRENTKGRHGLREGN